MFLKTMSSRIRFSQEFILSGREDMLIYFINKHKFALIIRKWQNDEYIK